MGNCDAKNGQSSIKPPNENLAENADLHESFNSIKSVDPNQNPALMQSINPSNKSGVQSINNQIKLSAMVPVENIENSSHFPQQPAITTSAQNASNIINNQMQRSANNIISNASINKQSINNINASGLNNIVAASQNINNLNVNPSIPQVVNSSIPQVVNPSIPQAISNPQMQPSVNPIQGITSNTPIQSVLTQAQNSVAYPTNSTLGDTGNTIGTILVQNQSQVPTIPTNTVPTPSHNVTRVQPQVLNPASILQQQTPVTTYNIPQSVLGNNNQTIVNIPAKIYKDNYIGVNREGKRFKVPEGSQVVLSQHVSYIQEGTLNSSLMNNNIPYQNNNSVFTPI